MYLKPKDIIAICILIGLFSLKLAGINGVLDATLALIVGYYFGHRTTKIDNGK